MGLPRLKPLLALVVLALLPPPPAPAASQLLDRVKSNPALARRLCADFRQLNTQGLSATSPQAIARVARDQDLNAIDAEVLTTYVIGLYCPEVR
ncbi:MAG: hypothetical protein ACKOPN_05755 [Prochlorococcaceae cyanobacterium]|jgi:hypothetical protein